MYNKVPLCVVNAASDVDIKELPVDMMIKFVCLNCAAIKDKKIFSLLTE